MTVPLMSKSVNHSLSPGQCDGTKQVEPLGQSGNEIRRTNNENESLTARARENKPNFCIRVTW